MSTEGFLIKKAAVLTRVCRPTSEIWHNGLLSTGTARALYPSPSQSIPADAV
jgi:hypothetical protein